MSEPTQPVPVFETKKWIGGLIIGLLLAETVLVLIGSLVRDVIFPLMAMAMGTDPSSPLSLGPQTFNWPNLLSAIMQFCLAAIVAILVNSWMQRRPRMMARGQSLSVTSVAPYLQTSTPVPTPVQASAQRLPAPVPQPVTTPPTVVRVPQPATTPPAAARPAPPAAAPVAAAPIMATAPAVVAAPKSVAPAQPTPQAAPKAAPPPAAPPAKPKKPKQVYYNLVGEPIESDDDD
jgi:large-conductance mechanosensitive channel